MGLIRKTLAVSTLGLVRGSSKKQRVAKAQLNELRTQTLLMQEQADALAGPADPLDSPVAEVRAAELRRINAQNEAMNLRPTERQQKVQLLWQMHKDGVLSQEQYTAAYEALENTATA